MLGGMTIEGTIIEATGQGLEAHRLTTKGGLEAGGPGLEAHQLHIHTEGGTTVHQQGTGISHRLPKLSAGLHRLYAGLGLHRIGVPGHLPPESIPLHLPHQAQPMMSKTGKLLWLMRSQASQDPGLSHQPRLTGHQASAPSQRQGLPANSIQAQESTNNPGSMRQGIQGIMTLGLIEM